MLFVAIESEAS